MLSTRVRDREAFLWVRSNELDVHSPEAKRQSRQRIVKLCSKTSKVESEVVNGCGLIATSGLLLLPPLASHVEHFTSQKAIAVELSCCLQYSW